MKSEYSSLLKNMGLSSSSRKKEHVGISLGLESQV